MAREEVMVEEGSWDEAYDGDMECDSVESIMRRGRSATDQQEW